MQGGGAVSGARQLLVGLAAIVFVLALCGGAAAALADEAPQPPKGAEAPFGPLGRGTGEEELGPATDPQAAKEMQLTELGRVEAEDLLTTVFPEAIQQPVGMFHELEDAVERFHSDHVAVVQGEGGGSPEPMLLQSALPLRTGTDEGPKAPVSLDLQATDTGFEPSNPLVDLTLPEELGEGISLPEADLEVKLAGAPSDRGGSVIDDSAVFYPNVATDTDLTVSPTPVGVETLVQLRSAAAPLSQTYELGLPAADELVEAPEGGAAVRRKGQTVAVVHPPSAIDAAGDPVPVSLSVEGDQVVVTVEPGAVSLSYPILVDPVIDTYHWTSLCCQYEGWYSSSNNEHFTTSTMGAFGSQYGLNIKSTPGQAVLGHASWSYYVPRYFSDMEGPAPKVRPTTYIAHATYSEANWALENESSPYQDFPALSFILWAEGTGVKGETPRKGGSGPMSNATINVLNPEPSTGVKEADITMYAGADGQARQRHLWIGQAAMELGDTDNPTIGSASGPQQWVNETTGEPIAFSTADPGLGVFSLTAKIPKAGGGSTEIQQTPSCSGGNSSPCPRNWSSSISSFSPAGMPQGEPTVELIARDALGKTGTKVLHFYVDHTKPRLTPLSGTLTEQASLGTGRRTYTVSFSAKDGDQGTPEPGAAIGSAGTGQGQLERPMGVALDASGNVWTVDRNNNKVVEYSASGSFIRQFGGLPTGSGNGQLNDPRGIAISPEGNVWLTEVGNKRLQEFSPTGQFIRTVTVTGLFGSNKLVEPYGLAVGPSGTLWVTDANTNKVYRIKEDGTYIGEVTTPFGGPSLAAPVGVAVDSSGNAWVSSNTNDMVFEFNSSGQYVTSFGTSGSAPGLIHNPVGMAVAPSGHIFVADGSNGRVEEFGSEGAFLRAIGSLGSGSGQLTEPRGIAVGPENSILVADASNHRVAKWSHADLDPQSGVASAQIKVDGTVVQSWSPGCLTESCAIAREWTLHADSFSTGSHVLQVITTDGVGLSTSSPPLTFESHRDETPPSLSLSGTATEQATLGTKWPTYNLKASATDGTAGAPQSGVAKLAIQFDGSIVKQTEPGCSIDNCALSLEWTIDGSKYAAGSHTIKVTATDALGNSKVEERKITLTPSPPELSLTGTMTEQASLGTTRPRYRLNISAASTGGEPGVVSTPIYSAAIGSAGAGNGQFSHPADVAIDAAGNLWVADQANNRLQEFNSKGEFIKTLGAKGSGSGQFSAPKSIAFTASGGFWVADSANNRLEQFNAAGEFVKAVGGPGSGNGQFNGPEGIAIDAKGNIWVSDTYNLRIQELNSAGEFIKVVNPSGLGAIEPTGIDAGPGGNVWVADWSHNRVVELSEAGGLVRSFGAEGTGNGQFQRPDAITIDSAGTVWVGDQNNARVQGFNQAGEYLTKFGSAGSGSGQFSFSYPFGMAADTQGNLWIADANNNRVQKWAIPFLAPTYSSSIGSLGSGNGQVSSPSGVVTGAEGHLFVADSGNSRIEEFNQAGEFVRTFGNGQLSNPAGLAVGPSGHLWVADTAANRIAEFNEEGQLVSSFKGSGENALLEPSGVAIDPAGHIWVADRGNRRIKEFTAKGEWLGTFKGTGVLFTPNGIAAGPDGRIWVSTSLGSSVQVFSASGVYEGKLTAPPAGFSSPGALTFDEGGELWVAEAGAGRVDRFSPTGSYMGEFGSPGSGTGQFGLNVVGGIAVDAHGNIWVADTSNNRVQKWKVRGRAAEITTEIFLDGKRVQAATTGCTIEQCPIAKEWMLESPGNEGAHTVLVKATDGLGNTTSKSLSINVQKDTTKPTIEAGGSLINAPEGWVEQEGYGVNVYAKDGGYGATSLELKIDGKQVASTSPSSCPDGGCEAHLQQTIDMAPYEGGAHPAELVAKDGAGNTETQRWTVNVDPAGQVSAEEVEATVSAAEHTAPEIVERTPVQAVVAESPGQAPEDPPGLAIEEGSLTSEGTPTESNVSADVAVGFEIKTKTSIEGGEEEEGEVMASSISAAPTATSQAAGEAVVVNGQAAVYANTASSVDTVIRPAYDGLMSFEAIRSTAAPEEYSWTVHLNKGEHMEQIDDHSVGVFWKDGSETMMISAEAAHGADGKAVQTTLTLSEEDVITLAVHYKATGVVLPVVAGIGWEGGYTVYTGSIVEPEEEETDVEIMNLQVSAPLTVDSGDTDGLAQISAAKPHYKTWALDACSPELPLIGGVIGKKCEAWKVHMRGYFYYNYAEAWFPNREPKCTKSHATGFHIEELACEWVPPNHQKYVAGAWQADGNEIIYHDTERWHITAQTRFYAGVGFDIASIENYKAVSLGAKGDGSFFTWRSDKVCNPMTNGCLKH